MKIKNISFLIVLSIVFLSTCTLVARWYSIKTFNQRREVDYKKMQILTSINEILDFNSRLVQLESNYAATGNINYKTEYEHNVNVKKTASIEFKKIIDLGFEGDLLKKINTARIAALRLHDVQSEVMHFASQKDLNTAMSLAFSENHLRLEYDLSDAIKNAWQEVLRSEEKKQRI